jgi:branched-subunit amino acid permease
VFSAELKPHPPITKLLMVIVCYCHCGHLFSVPRCLKMFQDVPVAQVEIPRHFSRLGW